MYHLRLRIAWFLQSLWRRTWVRWASWAVAAVAFGVVVYLGVAGISGIIAHNAAAAEAEAQRIADAEYDEQTRARHEQGLPAEPKVIMATPDEIATPDDEVQNDEPDPVLEPFDAQIGESVHGWVEALNWLFRYAFHVDGGFSVTQRVNLYNATDRPLRSVTVPVLPGVTEFVVAQVTMTEDGEAVSVIEELLERLSETGDAEKVFIEFPYPLEPGEVAHIRVNYRLPLTFGRKEVLEMSSATPTGVGVIFAVGDEYGPDIVTVEPFNYERSFYHSDGWAEHAWRSEMELPPGAVVSWTLDTGPGYPYIAPPPLPELVNP